MPIGLLSYNKFDSNSNDKSAWSSTSDTTGDGDDYVTVIYEDYDNVYADYEDFKSIIDLINSQYER